MINFLKYISWASFLFVASSCSVDQMIKKADKKYDIGEYYKAGNIYRRVYPRVSVTKQRSKKAYVAFRQGVCNSLDNDNTRAERALQHAVHYNCSDSSAYLFYADVLRKNKHPKEALANYDIYLQNHPADQVALAGKASALQAIEWEKNPTRYVISLVDAFNSKRSESSPSFPGGNPDVVYFASSRSEKGEKKVKLSKITGIPTKNIYVAKRNSVGNWDNIASMEGDMNTIDDEGSPCFTADGKQMFFTRCRYVKGESHGADIYTSTRSGGKWSKSSLVKLSKDSTVVFAHPAISSDGKILFFVSNLEGGYGKKDIWFSVKEGDKWGAPQNAGSQINTSGDEMFPTLRNDSMLYFSSNGWPGFGGLDVFYVTLHKDGHWSEPHNLMYPINSNNDDFGMSFISGLNKGMFSSNRNQRKGYDKIYNFNLPPVVLQISGTVTSSGESLQDATVRIVGNDGSNIKLRSKKDGSFSFKLNPNVHYVLLGNCRGYLNQSKVINTDSLEDSKTFDVDFSLASISKPVGLANIFFDFGQATITKESDKSLDLLVKLLNDNPNITIEIGAHTDRIGSSEGNLELSGKRAQSVVNYLIRKGIESARLTARGYGKTEPVIVNRSLSKQYSFLHEGQTLDDASIDNMTPEQQQIANQINRRTEFRVLSITYKMY